ncbi:MAG: bifunctional diaminohydroxyphosphoribosylaminopyrimidine deaminase/5-amino-6-(5-phosphoribosylamino)uracil reductase RibD [Bacillota bacterium]|jgi:diaminohydroxyphosphoribosylaminopyrimidine deaminase/5-amino-6-(5-phosphoribosylamino)uracil reductase
MILRNDDEKYMRLALNLAAKGEGRVSPNPLVGAVIVKNGKIIGKGWHREFGGLHAERNALADIKEDAAGAVMYVTLEPCCHYGKTPPCTEAILTSGIKRVVIGCIDPNPLVAGNGIAILQKAGIEVKTGVLTAECEALNRIFFHYIKTQKPYVIMKYAMTMDGKIATASGESRWITGEAARRHTHKSRGKYSAIMVGVGTVLADDPALTCRIEGGRNPLRIVCDTNLRTPLDSRIVRTAAAVPTLIATSCTEQERQQPYIAAGCKMLAVPKAGKSLDLQALMSELGKAGIDSILLEGGSALNFSALQSGIVNHVQAYIAPKLLGGKTAKTPIGGKGIQNLNSCARLYEMRLQNLGEDILIEGEVKPCVHGIS